MAMHSTYRLWPNPKMRSGAQIRSLILGIIDDCATNLERGAQREARPLVANRHRVPFNSVHNHQIATQANGHFAQTLGHAEWDDLKFWRIVFKRSCKERYT